MSGFVWNGAGGTGAALVDKVALLAGAVLAELRRQGRVPERGGGGHNLISDHGAASSIRRHCVHGGDAPDLHDAGSGWRSGRSVSTTGATSSSGRQLYSGGRRVTRTGAASGLAAVGSRQRSDPAAKFLSPTGYLRY